MSELADVLFNGLHIVQWSSPLMLVRVGVDLSARGVGIAGHRNSVRAIRDVYAANAISPPFQSLSLSLSLSPSLPLSLSPSNSLELP